MNSLVKWRHFMIFYRLKWKKYVLGETLWTFPWEIIPGQLILEKRHPTWSVSSISTIPLNFISFFLFLFPFWYNEPNSYTLMTTAPLWK